MYKESFIVIIFIFILLFIVAASNSYNGTQCERERIKDAIIDNPNITCIEYLKMKGE